MAGDDAAEAAVQAGGDGFVQGAGGPDGVHRLDRVEVDGEGGVCLAQFLLAGVVDDVGVPAVALGGDGGVAGAEFQDAGGAGGVAAQEGEAFRHRGGGRARGRAEEVQAVRRGLCRLQQGGHQLAVRGGAGMGMAAASGLRAAWTNH